MTSNRDEARRIAGEIRQAIEAYDGHLDGYMWGVHDDEHLRHLVMENDVEALTAAQRLLLPLQREYTPGMIGIIVKNIRNQGVMNAGELVTRESVTGWVSMLKAISDSEWSVGTTVLMGDGSKFQEVLLMAFTDPEIAGEVTSIVCERGPLPPDMIRGLAVERKSSVPALREGAL